jgi:hypothetical protein
MSNNNLIKNLLNSAKKPELGHDIHDNCVVVEVSVGNKTKKDGGAINRNCYTKFVKLNAEGQAVGEREISWFDLDFNGEYVKDNYIAQMEQLTNILECYITPEQVNDLFDPILKEFEITDEKALEDILTDKDNCKNLMIDITKAYVDEMKNHIGLEGTPLRVKFTFDSKGKYVQQPKFGIFVEPMSVSKADSKLKFAKIETEYEQKSHAVATNTAGAAKSNLSNL